MNVQELCDALVDRRQEDIDAVEHGVSWVPEETFDAALTEEWLADNVKQVATVANKESGQDEMTGNLEINAFLAAFQRAVEGMRTPRIKRWANRFTFKKRTISWARHDADGKVIAPGGALQEQLRSLGVKGDEEFMTGVIFTPTQEDLE
jgi:hypothetical protein